MSEIKLTPFEESHSPLNIFSTPLYDETIDGGQTHYYQPFNAITDDINSFVFEIPGHMSEYIVLSSIRIFGTANIKVKDAQGEWKAMGENDDVSCVSYLANTMFSNVLVQLNQKDINTSSTNAYPYKSFIEGLFSFSKGTKTNELKTALWEEDVIGTQDAFVKTANSGYNKRQTKIKKQFHFSTKLHHDLFFLDRYFL